MLTILNFKYFIVFQLAVKPWSHPKLNKIDSVFLTLLSLACVVEIIYNQKEITSYTAQRLIFIIILIPIIIIIYEIIRRNLFCKMYNICKSTTLSIINLSISIHRNTMEYKNNKNQRLLKKDNSDDTINKSGTTIIWSIEEEEEQNEQDLNR